VSTTSGPEDGDSGDATRPQPGDTAADERSAADPPPTETAPPRGEDAPRRPDATDAAAPPVPAASNGMAIAALVLGIVALAISIIGIPALLVWLPGFPVAVALAALLGYIAIAHAAGESFSERRFSHEPWYQRSNSYYFIVVGFGLLMAFFVASHIVQMAGPWLGFLRGMLAFFGGVITAVALATGFGAVLISRGGTRPVRDAATMAEPDLFREEAGV
jgi:hypothetical protein